MIRTILVLTIAFSYTVTGQVLHVMPGTEEPAELRFNPQFISRNGIVAVHGELFVKRDNEPMRPRAEKHLYRFDGQGHTTYANHSYGKPGSGLDTASVTFTFDAKGQVGRRLRNDLAGYFAYDIQRDDQGRPVRETYTRIENLGTDRYVLREGTITEISDEQFEYVTLSDSVWKRVHVNSLGLPFREQVHHSDRLGYLRTIEDHYLVNNRRSRVTFHYDENGRLSERIEQPDLAQARTMRRTWKYDNAGNVTESALWHDDVQKNREEFVYEEQTMMLKARLTLDMETSNIHIVRYTSDRSRSVQR